MSDIPKIPTPTLKADPNDEYNYLHMTFDIGSYIKEVQSFFDSIDAAMIIIWLRNQGYTVEHPDPTRIKRLLDNLPPDWLEQNVRL